MGEERIGDVELHIVHHSGEDDIAELSNFPDKWHRAIAAADPMTAQRAFTFWQLDEFLARLGYTKFRELAEKAAEKDLEAGDPTSGSEMPGISASAAEETPEKAVAVPGYRERYEAAIEEYRGREDGSLSVSDVQFHTAYNIVAVQLALVEDQFEEEGRSSTEIDWLMRRHWPLGYLYGVVTGLSDSERAAEEANPLFEYLPAMAGALTAGHRSVGYDDAKRLVVAAARKPEFAIGMERASEDLAAFVEDEEEMPMGLMEWMCESGGRGEGR